ncbi:MAG: MoxR family ATPase [Deltaproteobacteria bacterium]|nr:MoxR family ATPase [Deltaproteobacteria bacterium]
MARQSEPLRPRAQPQGIFARNTETLEIDAPDIQLIQAAVRDSSGWVDPLRREVGSVLVGQHALVERLLVALLTGGHILLEGVPGLAKTLALKTLARAVGAHFQRIQFTPDMLPADIVGTLIYNPRDGHFETKRGPIFANLVLADEINRAPAKVQSALLEAMQERQVTLGDTTHALPSPFLVMATQNPIEQEGTYPLPEAQVDRFLLKVVVTYPTPDEELAILGAMATTTPRLECAPVLALEDLFEARHVIDAIYVDEKVRRYIVSLVVATRDPGAFGLDLAPLIKLGASPRATIALTLCAKAWAFLRGRGYVTPQDVKAIAADVLRHRVAVTYEAEAERIDSDQIVARILDQVAIP